jgi:hypothetical protein
VILASAPRRCGRGCGGTWPTRGERADLLSTAEMVRILKMAKDSAVNSRTQALNQIKAILVTVPAHLR